MALPGAMRCASYLVPVWYSFVRDDAVIVAAASVAAATSTSSVISALTAATTGPSVFFASPCLDLYLGLLATAFCFCAAVTGFWWRRSHVRFDFLTVSLIFSATSIALLVTITGGERLRRWCALLGGSTIGTAAAVLNTFLLHEVAKEDIESLTGPR